MAAANRTLEIEQGATYFLGFTWARGVDENGDPVNPYDLTGCIARMQIRRKQADPVLLTATSADPGDPLDAGLVAAGAGRIRLGGVTGRIEITLTDEDTDMISAKTAAYDLEVEWPLQTGEIRPRVDRVLEGAVTVKPNITQVDEDDPVVT